MKAIHRAKATTLEGFAVKAAAVAFDQSDFEVSDPVPTDVAERMLYRLARDMAKAVKPADPAPSQLDALIAAHQASWAALDAACKVTDDAFGTPAEAAAEKTQAKASDATFAAISSIIEHPYASLEELKRGVAYVIGHHRATGDGDLGEWLLGLANHLLGEVAS
ncbi:hypothetical protein ASD64_05625 [Mesorhizobium sp. Root157]|uniref:hypothetical protein n=1 Tax=Mesorhizobium sp. Root157 TaxID=1736477 RepID=UPI0006F97679|nr:hypothetical protein [Mesorhizobium sp. Root157]KQZ86944.1 hypothetical protein ASD64_05625 [Mesorhizobium sp. Root157]